MNCLKLFVFAGATVSENESFSTLNSMLNEVTGSGGNDEEDHPREEEEDQPVDNTPSASATVVVASPSPVPTLPPASFLNCLLNNNNNSGKTAPQQLEPPRAVLEPQLEPQLPAKELPSQQQQLITDDPPPLPVKLRCHSKVAAAAASDPAVAAAVAPAAVAAASTVTSHLQLTPYNNMCPLPYKRSANSSPKKVASFATTSAATTTSAAQQQKKSSTVSLVASVEADPEMEAGAAGELLVRRNSIHGAVPFVDVNDPGTRARMEQYKQERRSALRAKYKAEDYRKSPSPEETAAMAMLPPPTPRKRTVSVATPPTPAPRPSRTSCPPAMVPSSPAQEAAPSSGHVEDDVNVKERAALFRSMTESSIPSHIAATAATARKTSDKAHHHSKIKDMAALFEQRT